MMIKDSMELSLLVDFQDFQRASNCTDEIGIGPNNVWPCQRKKEPKRKSLCHLCVLLQPLTVDSSVIGFRLVDFLSENIIVGSHGVPDPPSFALMAFTQCTSMSELKFDSGVPLGGQI